MDSKFIDINGLQLHYVERNEQERKILFFIHGNSGSTQNWYKQINDKLFNNFRVIALDLPGHGKSFRSKNPEIDYSPIGTSNILSKAIKSLATTNPYIIIGFSYGTNVLAEMLNQDLRPTGIVLAGSCVIGKDHGMEKVFVENETPSIYFYNEPNQKVVEEYFYNAMSNPSEVDIEVLKEAYLSVSSDFKPALFKTASEGKVSDEIIVLNKSGIPAVVIFGKQDKMVQIDYLDDIPFSVWKDQVYKLPNAGHWVNMEQADIFNQILNEYIVESFKSVHV